MLHLWPPRNREREWRSSFHCQNKKFSMENKYQNFLSLCTPCWSSYNNLIVYLETAQLATHSQTNQHIWYLWLFFFEINLKGILHQNKFYRLNLIFWIVMGCGIARFGRMGLKTTETWKFWSQILSPGVLRRFSDLSFCAVPRGPVWLPGTARVSVVFRPLRPKWAIPHPITIHNMRFRR